VNGDGKTDLIVNESGFGPSGVLLGNGDGTFGSLILVPSSGSLPSGALIADMNGDGLPDIVFPFGAEAVGFGNALTGIGVLINTTVPVAPNFTLGAASGSPTTQSVSAGQSASFNLVLAPTGSFNGTASLSCVITPTVTPAPTCGLSSSSVQITGSGSQTVTVTVGTTAPVTSGTMPHFDFPAGAAPMAWMMWLSLGTGFMLIRRQKRLPVLGASTIALALGLSVGCGGSSSSQMIHTTPGTPAGSYTVTVTGTSGNLSSNVALTVTVQ
jgi:hypothetical protein